MLIALDPVALALENFSNALLWSVPEIGDLSIFGTTLHRLITIKKFTVA